MNAIEPSLRVLRGGADSSDPLNELWNGKKMRTVLLEFALVMSTVMALISAYAIWKNSAFTLASILLGAATVLTFMGYRSPLRIKGFWRVWMAIGEAMGKVVTAVFLSFVWLSLFVPFSLGLKIFGKFVMDCSFRTDAPSHWLDRDPEDNDFKCLEKQF